MKNITIAGNIGRDATQRQTPNGDKVASWPVAVEERSAQDKRTIWFDCALWGKRGESLAQYLTKGSRVSVSGELSTREHEGKTYLTIRVDQLTLMGGGEKKERQEYSAQPSGQDYEDSIPF
jgi:single-strand DNA-binding protein